MIWLAGWSAFGALAAPHGVDEVVDALTARHAPTCAAVEALTEEPVAALLWAVDHVQQPGWVGMRAAQCLVDGHADQVREQLQAWVVDPQLRGLGRLVVAKLDALPEPLALDLAQRALTEGPEPDRTLRTLARARTPALRALSNR